MAAWLEVQDFRHICPDENVMATANPFLKAEPSQQHAKFSKSNGRIACTPDYAIQCLVTLHHDITLLYYSARDGYGCQSARNRSFSTYSSHFF